ncbi:Coiled-coil domain-containing protein [Penicillium canariense]|uniref:Coiled-coil domain-containing protein n=1 Tax=Penicillium canariense TaxID=189055 RepID=A0A9W9I6F2_9EURO|nr:Coiled-coil domain-containing protein [Penicillium canariense]KAJ5168869.1 Coiled-coil domain-containing protein [Penicillium canariense]
MQGFNMGRYVPPDQEGVTSANKLAGKHPLGARARHLHTTGALIVRFEMPFAVWCTTCKPNETIIGQGVRFNAEKKKIGNYYSTPIYSFRMKHTTCGGWIEIRTDPQNTAYVVVEGGRKRDTGEDKELQPGEIIIRRQDPAEKDPFAKLEGKAEDKRRAQTETSRILELQERQSRDWDDPYENSKRLRRTFRAERKGLERLEANREALKDKMSLGFDLVDETEEDRQRAGMVDFGDGQSSAGAEAARATRTRPMFETNDSSSSPGNEKHDKHKRKSRRTRTADLVAQRKASLRNELTGNTRAAVDPFLNDVGDEQEIWKPGVKRKKPSSTTLTSRTGPESPARATEINDSRDSKVVSAACEAQIENDVKKPPGVSAAPALVGYDSDTE